MPSNSKTDLLCKEEVSFSLPVAVFIEINWQGHRTALDGEDRKRGEKELGIDIDRGRHKKQQQQQQTLQ